MNEAAADRREWITRQRFVIDGNVAEGNFRVDPDGFIVSIWVSYPDGSCRLYLPAGRGDE